MKNSIFINQAGYLPTWEKRATLTVPADTFTVQTTDGQVRFEGPVTKFGFDKDSGDEVWLADFSGFQEEGTFVVALADGTVSHPFVIGEDAYDKLFTDIGQAYYLLRCGSGLEEKYAGKFVHKPCHNTKALLWEEHFDAEGNPIEGGNTELELSGGWHDAGDYGRYVTAGSCAVAHILYAYKMFPDILSTWKLNIPEQDSAMPDILEECKWELDWILKMQLPDGGVYHKVTTKIHPDFIMPEDDHGQLYVFPVSSLDVANFTAVCALAAEVYADYDAAFADRLKEAALLSGKWLAANPEFLPFHNPAGCNTGDYSEASDDDNRFWAWAQLFALTGDDDYLVRVREYKDKGFSLTELGYEFIGGLGTLAYILSDYKDRDPELANQLEDAFLKEAKTLAELSDGCGYGVAMHPANYRWGSNLCMLENGMICLIADYIQSGCQFRKYAARQLHYLMGTNATGYSFVTGNGAGAYNNPHLRPAAVDGIEESLPGMVSGGPNPGLQDPDAKRLVPTGSAPMKCYVDHVGSYSTNEITIYWNAPAVFLIAGLLDQE